MLLWYSVIARDAQGNRLTGLSPTWVFLTPLSPPTVPPTAIAAPSVLEIGFGCYAYAFDTELAGECVGQIDLMAGSTSVAGPGFSDGWRYLDQSLTRESSRLMTSVDSQGRTALRPSGLAGPLSALSSTFSALTGTTPAPASTGLA